MAAHKIKAIARTKDGLEVTIYLETIASQVICVVAPEDEEQEPTSIRLDELLNQYADEINSNTRAMQKILSGEISTGNSGGGAIVGPKPTEGKLGQLWIDEFSVAHYWNGIEWRPVVGYWAEDEKPDEEVERNLEGGE